MSLWILVLSQTCKPFKTADGFLNFFLEMQYLLCIGNVVVGICVMVRKRSTLSDATQIIIINVHKLC